MKKKSFFFLAFLGMSACSSLPELRPLNKYTSNTCAEIYRRAQKESTEYQLDKVSELYNQSCYQEVISLGNYIRSSRRDKFYNVTAELGEVVAPEGSLTEYVLESYERSYLSLLLSLSALKLGQTDNALVELRRSSEEQNAILYNYGEDPVINLLQASLWDRFDPGMARPFWNRLAENKESGKKLQAFAKNRITQIDTYSNAPVEWKIYGVGEFPGFTWKAQFLEKHPYKIEPIAENFPATCATESSLLMSTEAWVKKISGKYDSSYHPLVYTKSLMRAPVGLLIGAAGIATGFTVGVGGCVLAASGNHPYSGDMCKSAVAAAGVLIEGSFQVSDYVLKPDMRHWRKLPAGIYITQGSPTDSCSNQTESFGSMVLLQ